MAAEKGSPLRMRALSAIQERRLITFLDDQLLQLMRNHKKRSETNAALRTLPDYLAAARSILALVLQIPPINPSATLRTAYLLRLTGDVLGSIPGYKLSGPGGHEIDSAAGTSPSGPMPDAGMHKANLQTLLDFLDDLDCAWVAVLRTQAWDPYYRAGVDLAVSSDTVPSQEAATAAPLSQTEITRLRSLLIGAGTAVELWISEDKLQAETDDENVTRRLERMGLLEDFNEMFSGTWSWLDRVGQARVGDGTS